MLTIEFAKKLVDAEQRCNKINIDEACKGCPYEFSPCDKVYGCIEDKNKDIINFLKEWIDFESNRLDNF